MPTPSADTVNKHLETLGLKPDDLNEDAIRVAYKKLALRWHPDRHNADPEEAKDKFIEVNDAYKALVEVCKKKHKGKKSRKEEDGSSSRRPFWAGSTPSASSTSSSSTAPSSSSSSGATTGSSSSSSSSKSEPNEKHAEKSKAKSEDTPSSKKAEVPSAESASAKHSEKHAPKRHDGESSSKRDGRSSTKTRRSGDRDTPSHSSPKPSRSHSKSSSSAASSSTAHKSPHPFKQSNLHPDSDNESSSDCESICEHGHRHRHHHHHHHSHTKGKKAALGEDDYEFIDLGTPLKPLRNLKTTAPVASSSSKDWTFPLHITLEDLYFGATHRYRITRTLNAPSPDPHHHSTYHHSRTSHKQTISLDVQIAPGWRTGTRVRVPGVGNQRLDGTFQDIVFIVTEAPHARFVRAGDDLILPVCVPWVDDAHVGPRPYPPYRSGSDSSLDSESASDDDCEGEGDELRSGGRRGRGGGWYRFGLGIGAPRRAAGLAAGCAHGLPEDEVYVLGMDGEEYTLPIPRTLVEAADGTRVYGAGMPIRKDGKVVGKGDLVIRWEFVFPESDKLQRTPWQTLKDAMHFRFQV